MGPGLAEVHDRAGIPWQHLEALEAGDLSPFGDQRSALTAVRRYADLMALDAEQLSRVVQEFWGSPEAGFPGGPTPVSGRRKRGTHQRRPPGVGTAATGTSGVHLARYPGDGTHLRAFTQTDQVPGVRRVEAYAGPTGEAVGHFSATGVFPVAGAWSPPRRTIPLVLQAAIWCTVALLVVAVGGLAVHHWEPRWLVDIHVQHVPAKSTAGATSASGAGGGATSGSGGRRGGPKHPAQVTQTSISAAGAAVSVRAANFSVEIAATGKCWVRAITPQTFAPVLDQTLQSGQSATVSSSNGQLTIDLGSSYALLAVKINGKTATGWLFKPPSAPFVLNFSSAAS